MAQYNSSQKQCEIQLEMDTFVQTPYPFCGKHHQHDVQRMSKTEWLKITVHPCGRICTKLHSPVGKMLKLTHPCGRMCSNLHTPVSVEKFAQNYTP